MATILIVDDRASNREFLVTLLGYQGHRLVEATDGAEALALARAELPALVITDILMPTMDGYEFVQQLRADPAIARTPVIFYTAHYREREAQNLARACGVAHLLTKPCEPAQILRTVDAALGLGTEPISPPPKEDFDREHLRLLTDKLSQNVVEMSAANIRFAALIDISLQLTSELKLPRLVDHVCRSARDLIGAKYAVVALQDSGETTRDHFTTSGMDSRMASSLGATDLRQGVFGTLLAGRQVCRLKDPVGDPLAIGFPADFPPVHSFLGAPIASLEHVYGWLGLIDKLGAPEFSQEDERLAVILASQVGRIYEHRKLYAEVQRHANELERAMAERQRAEAEVRLLNEDLERRVRQRTAELEAANEALRNENKERRHAEQALRESEERFSAFINSSAVVAWMKDESFNYAYVNRSFERFHQITLEEIKGKNDFQLRPRATAEEQRENDTKVLTGGNSLETYESVPAPDGQPRLWWVFKFPLKDGSGRRFVGGMAIDVTERKRAEEVVHRSEERFFKIFRSSPAAIGISTINDGRLIDANERYLEFFGYRREELVGRTAAELNLWVDSRELYQVITRLLAEKSVQNVEARFRRKSGEIRHALLSMDVLQPQEEPWCIATLVDVTERQRALERSRESEERFRQLAENIGEVFWILDARNTEILYVSPAYERIWGRSCDSLYASPRSWTDAIHPEDRDRILAAEADPRSRQMHDHIYRIVRPDGAVRWIRDRAFPVKNEAGEVFRVTGLAVDITDHKLAEESLHQLSIRLLQAQDEERQRIACELHDSTAQKLAALKMNLGRLEEEMPRLSGMMKKVLGDSFDIAEACSQEIRTISYLLHPPLLDELGLAVALRAYTTGFSKRSGIQVSLKLPRKKERLSPEIELTLFRVVQESLGNIHRHSGSKTASIRLTRAASQAVMEVRDRGRGFPPVELEAVKKGKALPSVGIAGMQQRLRQIGGQLEILSGKTGTTVRASVPAPGKKS